MAFFSAPVRGYWKVRKVELELAQDYDGIEFPIDGTGANWEDGQGKVSIHKNSKEWNYLYQHISNLDSFRNKNENSSSKKIPSELRAAWKTG
jgi:hypothetical protein